MKWQDNDPKLLTVVWFSAGVSSAVATKLAINEVDRIFYIHIDDQHPDSLRFVKDCEEWFGKTIEIMQSPLKEVKEACLSAGGRGYINGINGASCTLRLKKKVREEWEQKNEEYHIRYLWGFDKDEIKRLSDLDISMPAFEHKAPLIEKGITKAEAHKILKASGIKRPAMYDLGYHNNNCIGCVKGGKGYWNKIKRDFPEVFEQRAEMERKIGHSCINGTFLDELKYGEGRHAPPICSDCGILCEVIGL